MNINPRLKWKYFKLCTLCILSLFAINSTTYGQGTPIDPPINTQAFTHLFGGSSPNLPGRGNVTRSPIVESIEDNDFAFELNNCSRETYRTIDGTCNNIEAGNDLWGAAGIQLIRKLPAEYGLPDINNDVNGQDAPSPRYISNKICGLESKKPSAYQLSSFVFTWGQFLDHDITLTPEGEEETVVIPIPPDDPMFTIPMELHRSQIHPGTGIDNHRQQTNIITSWIDGSNVYGSDIIRANYLRSFVNGKLKVSRGNMLPYNTLNGEIDGVPDPTAPHMASMIPGMPMFVAGDHRANEQPGLTALHTLFVREHNRICDLLIAGGMTNDEEIYQKARQYVIGAMQAITYEEFLPALGINCRKYPGYNPKIQPDVSNIFSTAAYRLGHTMVTDELLLIDDECHQLEEGSLTLIDAFFNPTHLAHLDIDPFLKGLSAQVQNETDPYIIDNLRNFLFGPPGTGAPGLDLASLNIQRGRDHGLPPYVKIRQHFTSNTRPIDFEDITTDPVLQDALRHTYDNDINNVEAWIGLLAEDHVPGKCVGLTLNAILREQFERLRDGDYYYYENDPTHTNSTKEKIKNTTLADIIKNNTGLTRIQDNVFIAEPCILASIDHASCHETCDGSIELNITGGYAPYSIEYKPMNGPWRASSGLETDLCNHNNHRFRLRDSTGDVKEKLTFTINQPSLLEVNIDQYTDVSCENESDGSITVKGVGGIPPYQYSLDGVNFQHEGYFSNLSEGNYEIYIKDIGHCSASNWVTIGKEEDCPPVCDCPDNFDPVCGVNGISYFNSCYAECEDITYSEGACGACEEQLYYNLCTSDNSKLEICPDLCFEERYWYTDIENLKHGTIRMNSGCLTYTPHDDYSGEENLEITACNDNTCKTFWLNIWIGNCNDNNPPIAVLDIANSYNRSAVIIEPLKNDSDPDNDPLQLSSFGQAANGQVSQFGNKLVYTPYQHFTGIDKIEYQVCDNQNACSIAEIHIIVTYEPCEDVETDFCIKPMKSLTFCPDFCQLEGDIHINYISTNYTCYIRFLENGCIRYAPLPSFAGEEIIRIQACDQYNSCETIRLNLTVGYECEDPQSDFYSPKADTDDTWFSDGTSNTLQSIGLSPNPAKDFTTISYETSEEAPLQIQVFDITGRLVAQQSQPSLNAGTHQTILDVAHLPTGLYMLHLESNGQKIVEKLIKE